MANRRITVRTLALNQQNEVLVLKRSLDDTDVPGRVDFPGGGVDPGETLMAAAIRETREEAGISLDERALSLEYAFTLYDEASDAVTTRILFVAYVETDNVTLSHEHTEYWWCSMDEVEDQFSATPWKDALHFVRMYRFTDLP